MGAPGSATSGRVGETDETKQQARSVVGQVFGELVELSHTIHAHPETNFAEERSAAATAGFLAAHGLVVTEGVGGLPTAFVATAGSGPVTVAICAEYDALPGVGHACGHNVIAAAAAGAGAALAAVADDVGLTVRVVGTPGEEGGGGKITLLDQGVFDGVHAALMVHPWPEDRLTATCLAVSHFDVVFEGRSAHASAAPWEGANAADAMVVAQVAIGLLRQQLPVDDQVHGIVTSGGEAANIVPGRVSGRFMARSRTLEGLRSLEPRVMACFEAGALAAGVHLTRTELAPVYSHMVTDAPLLAAYRANAEALGRSFAADDAGLPPPTLSTDMANVSLAVPTIHPLLGIEAGGAVNHQPEFAAACVTPSADRAISDGAVALAWTAIDAASDPALRRHLLGGAGV
ncbi:MAG: amidohydrolase [Acidimicrobiales bacterium]